MLADTVGDRARTRWVGGLETRRGVGIAEILVGRELGTMGV